MMFTIRDIRKLSLYCIGKM